MTVRRQSLIKFVVFSLLFGIFTVPQQATAVDTITKTFTVTDANNVPVSGALIRFSNYNPVTDLQEFGTITTTNSSGVAAITVNKDLDGLNYIVFPPAGNTSLAAKPNEYNINNSNSESIKVKLSPASLVVAVKDAAGNFVQPSDAAVICYPNSNTDANNQACTEVIRTGAFGIALPTNMSTTANYKIGVLQYVEKWQPNRFSWRYGIKAAGSSGSQTYTLYSDLNYTTALTAASNVYTLAYKSGNLQGTIKTSTGGTFTMPSGVTASVRITPFTPTGVATDNSNEFFNSTNSPNGNWNAYLNGPAGKYAYSVTFDGSTSVPSFIGLMWKNSAGLFSLTEGGTYGTSVELRLPASANLKLKIVKPSTTTAIPSGYAVIIPPTVSTEKGISIFAGGSTSGLSAASVPDGTYILNVYSYDGNYSDQNYQLIVTAGVAVVKTTAGVTINPDGSGIYNLAPKVPNFKIKAVSSANSATVVQNSYFEIRKGTDTNGEFVAGNGTGTEFGGANLVDGTYNAVVWPGNQWSTYKEARFTFTVASGVVSIPNLTADPTTGIFSIPLTVKNFRYKIVQSGTTTGVPYSWIDYQKTTSSFDQNNIDWNASGGEGVNELGQGGATLPNGYYFIVANMGKDSTDASKYYKLTIASGTVSSLTDMDGNAVSAQGDGSYNLSGVPANVTGAIKASDGTTDVTFAEGQGMSLQVQKWNSNNNNWDYFSNSWRTSATYGFYLNQVGKYRVISMPRGFPGLSQSSTTEFEIRDVAGVKKFAQDNVVGNAITTPLALNITMKVPNLNVKFMKPNGALMEFGWISIIKKETNGNQYWIGNIDMSQSAPGLGGANLADGTYRLEVNPQNGNTLLPGLSRKNYDLTVSGSGTTLALSFAGTPIALGSDSKFPLYPAASNISGQVVNASGVGLGNSNNKWININLQKYVTAENRWDWTDNWVNVDKNGFFEMSLSAAGKYRLRIEPNGFSDATTTFSEAFEVASGDLNTFNKAFGAIKLSAPSLLAKVVLNGSATAITNLGIEIRKNGQWLDWAGTGQLGQAAINFTEAGTYELVAYPSPTEMSQGATKKSYTAVVTKSTDGTISVVVKNSSGTVLTPSSGVYTLALGVGNLIGIVCVPSTVSATCTTSAGGIQNAQVVAINTATGQEMWEYSANTSPNGTWSMNLPTGTYKIMARAPWGSSTYGNSDRIGDVVVDASGNATVTSDASPRTASAFGLRLKGANWSGVIRTPSGVADAVVPYADVCLYTNNIWTCSSANDQGAWAMSSPTGFSAFSSDAILEIRDNRNGVYPMLRYTGATAVGTALGGVGPVSNLVHRFPGANFTVQVTATNSAGATVNVPNAWVSIDWANHNWLGGGQTNAQGIASFNIDTATVTSGDVNIRVEINGNDNFKSNFAPTSKTVSVATITAGMTPSYAATVPLDTPNFKAILREAGTSGAPVANSWIELFDDSTGEWKTGSNTDQNGLFSMNVPKPGTGTASYTLKVNPPWNGSSTSSSRSYTVKVTSGNLVTVTLKGSTTPTATEPVDSVTYYSLALASPSVSGTVVNPSNAGVRDSWVVPISSTTGEYFWQQGVNSKQNGSFSMALPDGSYKIEANTPWNGADLAKSAQCSVTVANGTVTTAAGGCVGSSGAVTLGLRAPNVTMTLTFGGQAVANANVGMRIGNWSTNAQSKSDGTVSLFIDRAAVLAANPGLSGSAIKINVWVDPPYGSSNIVRWECQSQDAKPLCQNLPNFNTAADYSASVGSVTFQGPNTKVKITTPAGAAVTNAWVNIFSCIGSACAEGNYGTWIGGSNTGSDGWAAFNITDTSTAGIKFKIEVNPPWNKKDTYSRVMYGDDGTGLAWSAVNDSTRFVGTPNATFIIKAPGGSTASAWAWVGVEEVNSSNIPTRWVTGVGTDGSGTGAVTLGSNKRYRISANPSNGNLGARTECIVTTDGSAAVTLVSCTAGNLGANNTLTISLNNGNVVGTIKYGAILVSGAFVVATSTAGDIVPTTSGENGRFGLQLDPAKTWSIRVVTVTTVNGDSLAAYPISSVTAPSGSTPNDLGDIILVKQS
ncbi:hypothetical protein MCERE85_01383 [Candidatus Nanopelagicaceae bacterium]